MVLFSSIEQCVFSTLLRGAETVMNLNYQTRPMYSYTWKDTAAISGYRILYVDAILD